MNLYRLRVSIMGIPKVYRIIEVAGNCTFDDLQEAIFEAFDRYDPHLYSITGSISGTTGGTGSGFRASGKQRRRKSTSK